MAVAALTAAALVLGACASGGGGAGAGSPQKGVAPPAGHPLAKIEVGMTPDEVERLMGDPMGEHTYGTGKQYIPFYFGPSIYTEWKYRGQGRVVFGHNRWSGKRRVVRVDYDPKEDGS